MQVLSAENLLVNFLEKDWLAICNPYNDAIVIMMLVINYQIRSILIDIWSLVNIIIMFVFDEMNLMSSKLASTVKPPL